MSDTKKFDARKPHVLVTHSEIPQIGISMLQEKCDVTICPELPFPTREQILSRVNGVDALFWSTHEAMNKEVMDAAGPNLRVVSTMSAGYDHIDVYEAHRRGIKVGYTPHVLTSAVAEVAVTLLLEVTRRIPEGRDCVRTGSWEVGRPQWLLGKDIVNSTVGIIGLGGIGQAIAKRLKSFEISRLLYCGNNKKPEGDALGAEFVSFETLLRQSDFVVVSCPLNDATKFLFNDETFALMKRSAVFVNISRGGIVDQGALVRALESGTIWGAGLDVTTPEPLPLDHPLHKLKNCVISPHLGSATERTRASMAELTARNILEALDGKEMPCPL